MENHIALYDLYAVRRETKVTPIPNRGGLGYRVHGTRSVASIHCPATTLALVPSHSPPTHRDRTESDQQRIKPLTPSDATDLEGRMLGSTVRQVESAARRLAGRRTGYTMMPCCRRPPSVARRRRSFQSCRAETVCGTDLPCTHRRVVGAPALTDSGPSDSVPGPWRGSHLPFPPHPPEEPLDCSLSLDSPIDGSAGRADHRRTVISSP